MLDLSSRQWARRAIGDRRGLLQITCTAVLWGTGGVVVQLLHDDAGLRPVPIAFYRLAVAAAVLLLVSSRHVPELRTALRTAPVLLIVIGAGLAVYQALYFVAITDVGISVATMISIGLAPVVITLGEAMGRHRLPTLTTTVTVTVATSGLALVTLGAAHAGARSPHPVIGLLCAVGSGLGYAGTTVLSRQAAAVMAPLPLTTVTTTLGALALAPAAAIGGLGFTAAAAPVLELAYLGPMTTALAFALFYLGLRTTPTSTAAVLTLLEPVAAAVLATAVLGDPLPVTTITGGLLMLGAVAALYIWAPMPTTRGAGTGLVTNDAAGGEGPVGRDGRQR